MRHSPLLVALLAFACTVIAGCGRGEDPRARLPVPVAGAILENDGEFPRLVLPDGSKTENDRCIVRQTKLTPELPPVWVNGRPIGFCWTPCVTAFVEGPDDYLEARGITLPSILDPSQPAVIDAEHRVFLNYEVFYFASDELKQRFLADPIAYCGQLTDPVTLRRFRPTAGSPRRDYGGRIYLFPAEESAAAFDTDPHRYAVPVYQMM